jgi:hypothetical protein
MRETQILLGNSSRDGRISLFLLNRHIYSQDGGTWTPLDGFVQVDSSTTLKPLVEAECTFHFKSTIGVTHEKVVYSEMKIPQSVPSEDSAKAKYSFSFEFGTKALPPTFLFDPSEWSKGELFGVTWIVSAFLVPVIHAGVLSRSQIQIASSTHAPFQVGYRYSNKLLRTKPDLGQIVCSSGKKFLLFTRNTNVQVKARVVEPICKLPLRRIRLQLEFINFMHTHHVESVMVVLKQKILLQLHSGQLFRFKKSITLHNEQPAPRYDGDLDRLYKYDLNIEEGLDKVDQGCFAKSFPLFWKPEDGTDVGDLVPSTVFQSMEPGMICVSCEYQLKIRTNVIELNSGDLSENTVVIPIVISEVESGSFATSPSSIGGGNYISNESFMPILAGLMEDIDHTLLGLDTLVVEWRMRRMESGNMMVTQSADHAILLIDILESFYVHLQVFMEYVLHKTSQHRIPWTSDNIPFNMFLLELELLIRACPSAPAYSSSTPKVSVVENLLLAAKDFLSLSKLVVYAWIKPFEGDPLQTCRNLEKMYKRVHLELQGIADGKDTDWGQSKPDPELAEALRLSLLEQTTYT